ncbi:hypothetical protein [Rathayibacter sp. SD072]|uniref:hypothetical protein n=1 Tax=Rathayibacter sp. SD072 TaxID=2781731 RepID=UPI001A96E6B9|nr:hypothetical protein [Rathayibacter sp. SD072]MBO0984996.1 hypothetical protein [Rathayibacter sp. SD072]
MTTGSSSSEHFRSWLAVIISLAALIVSSIAFIAPLRGAQEAKDASVAAFLDRLVEPSARSTITAGARTEADSAADEYTRLLSQIWEAWEYSEGAGTVEKGSWEKIEDGYSVCFPKLDLLTSGCQKMSDFQFADGSPTIVRFSIDDVPVERLVDRTRSSITTDDESTIDVWSVGVLTDPSFETKTVVLWTSMRDGESHPQGTTYSLSTFDAQNEREEWLEDPAVRLRAPIGRYEAVLGGFRTKAEANLIYSCWLVEPATSPDCVWLNLSL